MFLLSRMSLGSWPCGRDWRLPSGNRRYSCWYFVKNLQTVASTSPLLFFLCRNTKRCPEAFWNKRKNYFSYSSSTVSCRAPTTDYLSSQIIRKTENIFDWYLLQKRNATIYKKTYFLTKLSQLQLTTRRLQLFDDNFFICAHNSNKTSSRPTTQLRLASIFFRSSADEAAFDEK